MSARAKDINLLEGSILKHIIRLSWPMVIAFTFQTSFNFVDRFFVSRVGDIGTAAIGMAFLVQLILIALGSGLGVGVNSFIARNLGAKKTDAARETALHSIVLALAVGFTLTVVGLLLQRPIFTLLGASGQLLEMIIQYLTVILWFAPVVMLLMLGNNIFRGWGDTMLPMRFMLTGTFLNVALDPILILGWGPIPPMGIRGAAWATAIARSIAVLYLMSALFLHHKPVRLKFSEFKFNPEIVKGIFQVGLPSTLSQFLTSFAMGVIFVVLKPFGALAKAAYTISFTYEQLAFLPMIGVAQAVTTLTGHNFGAKKLDRVKETYRKGIMVSLAMMGVGTIAISLGPQFFARIFARSDEVLSLGSEALRITALGYVFFSFYLISIASFQGLGMGNQYLWANLLRLYLLQIPLAYLGAHIFQLRGVWMGLVAGTIISALTIFLWYLFVFRRRVLTGKIQPL